MTGNRRVLRRGAAIVGAAAFLAAGGTALAVGERDGSVAQRCAQGAVRGIAHVTGGPSGTANIPGQFSGAGALFARRFNCTRGAVQIRRLGIGVYEVRFAGNGAPTAVASGVVGSLAAAERVAPGIFRVNVYPAGRADPADLPFVLLLV
jgi:hypothetical protein